jgi:multidrug resistance efflux pump
MLDSSPADTLQPQQIPRERNRLRPALFALLPLVLLGAGCAYVLGGEAVETDDAYVEADSVGVSTDVSGFVKDVAVTENQHVDAQQILYRLDDLPFRLAVERAQAEVGIVRDDLLALKASYRDMQAQLEMASQSVDLQRISYGSGGSGIIGLLDAQRQRQQALLGLVRAQAQQYQDTTQLFVAMGGGWWSEDNEVAQAGTGPL